MKCFVPEISWHNRDPVYSVDFQPKKGQGEDFYRLASGGADCHVVIWHVTIKTSEDAENNMAVSLECAADLQRHQKCVNVVRFSPNGQYLASGDDDGYIIIWKMREEVDGPVMPGDDDKDKEAWIPWKVLRGHLQDVYDLAWSPDSAFLVSGSIDNTALVWDVEKRKNLGFLGDHKGFVQGVAWDPKNKYVATLSSDRNLKVFDAARRKQISKCFKGKLPSHLPRAGKGAEEKENDIQATGKEQEKKEKQPKMFHGDTVKTFFRRLTFSPAGDILIAPCGVLETADKNHDVSHVFIRGAFSHPALHLPSIGQFTVAARCSPLHYECRGLTPTMFSLPYRIVYALATRNSVMLYDTEQPVPFGCAYDIHYTGITDLTWSPNGKLLICSSSEGFCSVIAFEDSELGVEYNKTTLTTSELKQSSPQNGIDNMESMDVDKRSDIDLLPTSLKSTNTKDYGVFKTPTKKSQWDGRGNMSPSSKKYSVRPSLDGTESEDMNASQCSQISELSVCLGTEEGDLMSKEEQARRLMSPFRGSPAAAPLVSPTRLPVSPSPQKSPATPKSGRRVNFITLSSPKSKKKLL